VRKKNIRTAWVSYFILPAQYFDGFFYTRFCDGLNLRPGSKGRIEGDLELVERVYSKMEMPRTNERILGPSSMYIFYVSPYHNPLQNIGIEKERESFCMMSFLVVDDGPLPADKTRNPVILIDGKRWLRSKYYGSVPLDSIPDVEFNLISS
jgi:hypothetical protein